MHQTPNPSTKSTIESRLQLFIKSATAIGFITGIFVAIHTALVLPVGNLQYAKPFALALASSIISLLGSFFNIFFTIIFIFIFISTLIHAPTIAKANLLKFLVAVSICLLPALFFFILT